MINVSNILETIKMIDEEDLELIQLVLPIRTY